MRGFLLLVSLPIAFLALHLAQDIKDPTSMQLLRILGWIIPIFTVLSLVQQFLAGTHKKIDQDPLKDPAARRAIERLAHSIAPIDGTILEGTDNNIIRRLAQQRILIFEPSKEGDGKGRWRLSPYGKSLLNQRTSSSP